MPPTNRLDSVPSNVLRGARIPNVIAGFGLPARAAPPARALPLSAAGVGVIAVILAILVALLVPILGGRVP